jgi:hypothetical protein
VIRIGEQVAEVVTVAEHDTSFPISHTAATGNAHIAGKGVQEPLQVRFVTKGTSSGGRVPERQDNRPPKEPSLKSLTPFKECE